MALGRAWQYFIAKRPKYRERPLLLGLAVRFPLHVQPNEACVGVVGQVLRPLDMSLDIYLLGWATLVVVCRRDLQL